MTRAETPTEGTEQKALFRWAAYQERLYPELKLLHHIPNGGYRTPAEAGKFRAMGVKAGVPDLFLPVARGGFHGLYIELKRVDHGKASALQKGWMEAQRSEGYKAVLCHGWVEASEEIVRYLMRGE